jgi:GT2 family glycosyltransferase
VSVVVPTHDRRHLLERLLQSLAGQTLDASQYEVIVVHNHTGDGTEEFAREWCARQAFAARYERKDFNGPARSRDFGARAAKGRYVAFIDDDCVATPDWLAAGVAAFTPACDEQGRTVGFVQGPTTPMPGQPRPPLSKTIDIPRASIFYETCNMFYLRSAFEQVGGFSADFIDRFYGEDTDLGWKMAQAGFALRFAPRALVHHEIFRVTLKQWLAEPLHFRNLPHLVAKYPGLRRHMYLGYFVSKDSCLFNVMLLGFLLLPVAGLPAALLALPFFAERWRNGAHIRAPHYRLLRALAGAVRGAFAWWALARGSLSARAFLL